MLTFTNSLSPPHTNAVYVETNFEWEEVEIDLTPFAGNVITLVWQHQLLAFEAASRPGWLLDDVRVTVTNVPPVTLQITNTLAQARFTLRGPLGPPAGRPGQGFLTLFTNAPPGDYSVTWQPVAYYTTPGVQSNSVPPGGSALFTGHYTFPDANTNGISDIWEQQYWGGVSPNRTRASDSDQDGFTDYAEFTAGTNPTLTNSHLRVTTWAAQGNGTVQLQWPTVSGRIYQVQATTDFNTWTPVSPWLQAAGSLTTFAAPAPAPGQLRVHRVEVRP